MSMFLSSPPFAELMMEYAPSFGNLRLQKMPTKTLPCLCAFCEQVQYSVLLKTLPICTFLSDHISGCANELLLRHRQLSAHVQIFPLIRPDWATHAYHVDHGLRWELRCV